MFQVRKARAVRNILRVGNIRTKSSHEFVQSTGQGCQLNAAVCQADILQWGWSLKSGYS